MLETRPSQLTIETSTYAEKGNHTQPNALARDDQERASRKTSHSEEHRRGIHNSEKKNPPSRTKAKAKKRVNRITTQQRPQHQPVAQSDTMLLDLNDDLWLALARHLDLVTIHSLTRASAALRTRLNALMPQLLATDAAAPDRVSAAVTTAIADDDSSLAAFALFRPPQVSPRTRTYPAPESSHPLFASYLFDAPRRRCTARPRSQLQPHDELDMCPDAEASRIGVSLPVASVMLRAFERAGGELCDAVSAPLLSQCPSTSVVLAFARRAAACRTPSTDSALQSLIVELAFTGRADVVAHMLTDHPHLARACGHKADCDGCLGRHTLLHAAASTGCADLVDLTLAHIPDSATEHDFIASRDCSGNTALSLAVRSHQSQLAQDLVKHGANIGELVGCVAQGSSGISASQIWFEQALDVD